MKTPICDFVAQYAKSNPVRLHMPGHKGKAYLGYERLDITEVNGADSLYEADGIIAQSEDNVSLLFGSKTFYSAEGSSLAIRAMLYLAMLYAKDMGRAPLVFAGRNAHKVFINTASLLDFEIKWLYPDNTSSYLSCNITPEDLESALKSAKELPMAVYLTSPDYLGNTVDIKAISRICKNYGVLLLVDNAHGAYLRFLSPSQHPIDLGADMCADSAHKTLPVLTGGAYLHVSNELPDFFKENAKKALGLFGSTSPSYIILQSLDYANRYLAKGYKTKLKAFLKKLDTLKEALTKQGYTILGNEPLKLTIDAKQYGYSGDDLAEILRSNDIECEFSDPDYLVLMFTPDVMDEELTLLKSVFCAIPKGEPIKSSLPKFTIPKKAMTPREAALSPCEYVDAENAVGRILAFAEVGCPPAVPVAVSGEVIDESILRWFKYYEISRCCVVKD